MKLEIIKETKIGGQIYFLIYLDGSYQTLTLTLEDAMKKVESMKKFQTATKETVYTETI
jgi:hypothetical protein